MQVVKSVFNSVSGLTFNTNNVIYIKYIKNNGAAFFFSSLPCNLFMPAYIRKKYLNVKRSVHYWSGSFLFKIDDLKRIYMPD